MTKNSRLGLQEWAHIATIVAGVTTAAALIIGLLTYLETSKAQRQAAEDQRQVTALSALQSHFELAVENPDLAYRDSSGKLSEKDLKRLMFAFHAISTAETIYNLRGDDPQWRETTRGLVKEQLPLVRNELPCEEYTPEFRRFIRDEVDASVCPEQ